MHRVRTSPVPLAPEGLAGMALCRGEVIPVLELSGCLSAPAPIPSAPRPRVLVLQQNGILAGIAADRVSTASGSSVPEAGAPLPCAGWAELADGARCRLLDPAALYALFDRWMSGVSLHPTSSTVSAHA
jgi:hypothetical protein